MTNTIFFFPSNSNHDNITNVLSVPTCGGHSFMRGCIHIYICLEGCRGNDPGRAKECQRRNGRVTSPVQEIYDIIFALKTFKIQILCT